jgi:hypothetical protein
LNDEGVCGDSGLIAGDFIARCIPARVPSSGVCDDEGVVGRLAGAFKRPDKPVVGAIPVCFKYLSELDVLDDFSLGPAHLRVVLGSLVDDSSVFSIPCD